MQSQLLGCIRAFADQPPGLVVVENGLGEKLGSSYAQPDPAEAITNCESFCSSEQVAQGHSQTASDIDLHQSPSQEALELTYPVTDFR